MTILFLRMFFEIISTPAFFPQGEGSIPHSNFIHKEAVFSSPGGVRFFVLRSHFVWNYWGWHPFACWLRESFRNPLKKGGFCLCVFLLFFLKSPHPRLFPQGEGSILHSNFIHKEAVFSSPEGEG